MKIPKPDVSVTTSACSDREVIDLATTAGRRLMEEGVSAALVLLSSRCPVDDHGSHTTSVLMANTAFTGKQAKGFIRVLRQVASDLEAKFCAKESN